MARQKSLGDELRETAQAAEAQERTRRERKAATELARIKKEAAELVPELLRQCVEKARKDARSKPPQPTTKVWGPACEDSSDERYGRWVLAADEVVKKLRAETLKAEVGHDVDVPIGSDPLYPYTRYTPYILITR